MSEERKIGNDCIDEARGILGLETTEEAHTAFGSWMNECFPDMWEEAGSVAGLDDDDFNHFADGWVCAIGRSSGSGGGKGEAWSGMLIGFERRFDMMERKRNMAIDTAVADIGSAIKNGFNYNSKHWGIGRVFASDGVKMNELGDNVVFAVSLLSQLTVTSALGTLVNTTVNLSVCAECKSEVIEIAALLTLTPASSTVRAVENDWVAL